MVGARAPGTEQISQLASYFLTRGKRRKMTFLEGYPAGWGCVQGLGRGGPGAVVPGG